MLKRPQVPDSSMMGAERSSLFDISLGADVEDDIDALADTLHIEFHNGGLPGLDVYILLYRIKDGRLYLLEVLVVGIEVGQVVALYDTGLFVAHAADLQIQVFYAYPVVVDVIVQIVYADDGSGDCSVSSVCTGVSAYCSLITNMLYSPPRR